MQKTVPQGGQKKKKKTKTKIGFERTDARRKKEVRTQQEKKRGENSAISKTQKAGPTRKNPGTSISKKGEGGKKKERKDEELGGTEGKNSSGGLGIIGKRKGGDSTYFGPVEKKREKRWTDVRGASTIDKYKKKGGGAKKRLGI